MSNPTCPAPECGKPPTIAEIQRAVCERFGIRLSDMISASRRRPVCLPRQVAMCLAYNLTANSMPQVARKFGGRDHTTVLHACRIIPKLAAEDEDLAAAIGDVRAALLRLDVAA